MGIAVAALFLATLSSLDEIDVPDRLSAVQTFIEQEIEQGRLPSLAVGVMENDRILWAKGYGTADLEAGTPATSDSIYRLASISKPLVATGLMVLVDEGGVDLDVPANRYLAGNPLRAARGSSDDITLRRLANHTAGFSEHWSFFYPGTRPPVMAVTLERYGFAYCPPGTRWAYSNLAFGIIDHIVERVSGQDYAEFLEQRVFEPLGMHHTGQGAPPGTEAHATAQYRQDVAGRFVRIPVYDFDHRGASALWSSARDLLRFAAMHADDGEWHARRILSAESALAMRTKTARLAGGGRTGIAWFVDRYRGRERVRHSGSMPGVSTHLWVFPASRSAIVALANGRSGLPGRVCEQVASLLFTEAASGDDSVSSDPRVGEELPPKTDTRIAGRFEGRVLHYRGDIPFELRVTESKGLLGFGARSYSAVQRFGGNEPVEMQSVRFENGSLFAMTAGSVAAREGVEVAEKLRFRLDLQGDNLVGVCTAIADATHALPHLVLLTRVGKEVPWTTFDQRGAPAVRFKPPPEWIASDPTSSMRLAQYRLGGEDSDTSCVIYFFGEGGGGGAQANIDRWTGQFETDSKSEVEEIEVAEGIQATLVDVAGRYRAEVRPGATERHDQADWRMLGAILKVPGGPLFIKLVGPRTVVDAGKPAFDAFVRSFRAAAD